MVVVADTARAPLVAEADRIVVVVDLDAGLRITGRLDPDSPPAAMGAQVTLVSANGADTVFTVRSNP